MSKYIIDKHIEFIDEINTRSYYVLVKMISKWDSDNKEEYEISHPLVTSYDKEELDNLISLFCEFENRLDRLEQQVGSHKRKI